MKQKRQKAKRSDRLKRISNTRIDTDYYAENPSEWQPDDDELTDRQTLAGISPEKQRSADARRALERLREQRFLKAAIEDDIYQPE